MTTSQHGIVVGVTGPGENTAALRWAAQAAEARGSTVTLVHAVHTVLTPPPPSVLLAAEPMIDVGRQLLRQVADELVSLAPDCTWSSLLEPGSPAAALTDLSREADLVVLAHRHLPRVRRLVTGSNATSVASHARCPVVAVPTEWQPSEATDEPGWVTVGVHDTGTPTSLLEAAFDAATARGLRLRLVHAWRLDPAYDEIVVERVDPGWRERIAEQILTAAEPVSAKHPDVPVEVLVEHEWPAQALVHLAETSELLVLGRHGHHAPMPRLLGSMARTALREAPCPVMITPV